MVKKKITWLFYGGSVMVPKAPMGLYGGGSMGAPWN